MRKVRKDARCHGVCGNLRSECWCGWQPPKCDHDYSDMGRPRRVEPLGLTEYDIAHRDNDAPAWFHEAMLLHEKWLTVQQFAELFGTHATQVRRWCDLGFIRCAWTDNVYYKTKDGKKSRVKWRHYCFHRREEERATHRRILASEVERCQFLKARQRGCGRDPRFGGSDADGTRRIEPSLAPEPPRWHKQEPKIVSIPRSGSEPSGVSKPSVQSESSLASTPPIESEPEPMSKPTVASEPIQKRETTVQSDDIDLSVFEE